MVKGTIVWWTDRGYGAAIVDRDDGEYGGKEVFLHLNNSVSFEDGGQDEPKISLFLDAKNPKKGNRVVLLRITPGKGERPKAQVWGLNNKYAQVQTKIFARQTLPFFRVIQLTIEHGGQERRVLWEGRSIVELNITFPRTKNPVLDPLVPCRPPHGDSSSYEIIFERQMADGNWVRCDDPRPRERE